MMDPGSPPSPAASSATPPAWLGVQTRALHDHSLLGVDRGRFCAGADFELLVDVFKVLADGPGADEDGYETVWFYQRLAAACAQHER